MFYSHEILTQRKYGVATIWLVATLGSKSNLKKVLRKDIMSVNVPKACKTVIYPEAPLALRLQSNLLYGISRVYSQQCQYFYNDVSMAHANLRKLIVARPAILDLQLDSAAGRLARPELLILQDDPAYLPDLSLDALLLDNADLFGEPFEEGESSLPVDLPSLSPNISSSVRSFGTLPHLGSEVGSVGIAIPTSDTGAGDYGFLPGLEEEPRLLEDVDFEFDENGEMREISPHLPKLPPRGVREPGSERFGSVDVGRGQRPGSVVRSGTGLNSEDLAEQVRREHEEGMGDSAGRSFGEDDNAFLPPEDQQMELYPDIEPLSDPLAYAEDEIEVPVRQKRARKVIMDAKTELKNVDLAAWRDNYLANMEAASKRLKSLRNGRQAKVNAVNWVFGGIGGNSKNPFLKNSFSGAALLEAIKNTKEPQLEAKSEAAKRKRSPGDLGEGSERGRSDSEGRRVLARIAEGGEEMGMGMGIEEDIPMAYIGDEPEIGRDVPPDIPSEGHRPSDLFPWNRPEGSIASGQGGYLPSVGGVPTSSVAGRSYREFGSRTGFRVSASPLFGRSARPLEKLSSVGVAIGEEGGDTIVAQDEELAAMGLAGEEAEFEFFGPGASVDTQAAQGSQWLNDTMEKESGNFFEYLKTELSKRHEEALAEDEEINFVTFEQLIPPATNSQLVAAQALHHTLLIATKGLIYVSQEDGFGEIQMTIL
ncbi:R8 protein [Rhizina undulata]